MNNKGFCNGKTPGRVISGVLTGVLAVCFMFVVRPALADAQHEYDKAVSYMNKGYAEIGKVVNDLDDDKEKSATKHFNKALKEFGNAATHFAKAELPAEDQPAIKAMKKGLDALRKCVTALEKDDMDTAQKEYDAAQSYFAEASVLLD